MLSNQLFILPGLIDGNYRDEILVSVVYVGDEDSILLPSNATVLVVLRGFTPVDSLSVERICDLIHDEEVAGSGNTNRGGGFGSTGV